MGAVYRFIKTRWFNTALGVLFLSLLVWFMGPLLGIGQLHPLETEVARWITIAALWVLWLVTNLLAELRARKRDKELAAGVVATAGPTAEETASAEEVALLSDRFKEALSALKKSKLGGSRKRLASLPWYMFVGPPGAGKTTALLNCGLKFPLADAPGIKGGAQRGTQGGPSGAARGAVAGVGGTRNCDWWFTDDAVLIDTAGRYTTQDSHSAVDSAAWLGFLRMLKKQRKRQPLNGVLVAISLSDLSLLPEAERLAHAQAVRRRVRELHDELGVRLPVYVLFTKADLVEGFVEFFDNLGKEEREQVWGATFALDDGKSEGGAVAAFSEEFDLLLARLNDRMLERVQQEADMRRRRLIYGFPQQVASLRDVADEFLAECFRPSRLEARPLLRGVYLTSGTQEGTPIDRLLGTITSEFGLPRQAAAGLSGTGRSYFLSRLVREVVFGEAALVSTDPKVERRARWIHRGAWAAAGAVTLLLFGVWTYSYIGNRDLITQVHAATTTYAAQYAELAKRGAADADLAAPVPALDTLRGIHGGYGHRDAAIPIALTFGLYQGAKLGIAASETYLHAVNRLLLPRLVTRAEAQLVQALNSPDALYGMLKIYLILGKQGPLDRDLILNWLNADLERAYPAEEEEQLRQSISAHAEAMLKEPLEAIPLNEALVAQARAVLTREPLAQYSYQRLLRSRRVQSIPAWTVAENGGPVAGRAFETRSGKPLDTGIPGIYTWSGYHNVFQPLLATVAQDLSEDGWVLGRGVRDVTAILRDAQRLRRDVTSLYLEDYVRRWDALLADLVIRPFSTMQDGLDLLSTLSGPASPLRELLQNVDAQVQLSRASSADAVTAAAQQRATRAGQRLAGFARWEAQSSGVSSRQFQIGGLMADIFGTDAGGKPVDPAKRVDDHFRALHTYVTAPENSTAPMEATIQRMATSYQTLSQASNAAAQGQVVSSLFGPGAGAAGQAGAAGGGAGGAAGSAGAGGPSTPAEPAPVGAMVQAVNRNMTQVVVSGASQELTNAWRTDVAPLCEALQNRYPLVRNLALPDIPADDFVRLLGPGGKIDAYFEKFLKPFVDTVAQPWKWRQPDRAPPGVSVATLLQFDLAQQIREGLFTGGAQFQARFQLVPVSIDPRLARVLVDIGGTTLANEQGPTEPQQFQWPGPGGKTGIRVTMTSATGGQVKSIEADGPWALLRMLDQAVMSGTGQPDKVRITFRSPSGDASFDLNASSVRNPFTLPALRSFRCPAKL